MNENNEHAEPFDDEDEAEVHEPFYNDESGLYFRETPESRPRRISDPLYVDALVRSVESAQWGKQARWRDPDGKEHVKVFPLALLQGDGLDLFRLLADEGLQIEPGLKVRNLLLSYLIRIKPTLRLTVAARTGWCEVGDGWVFVTPGGSLGRAGAQPDVVLSSEYPIAGVQTKGSWQEWRDGLGVLCADNTRLLLAVSMAFATVLLPFSTVESGGVHFIGSSSVGKTTVARAAASVFGGPHYIQRWRATANGLETMAAVHHCRLLVLDEMGQVSPREVGDGMYMLANGQGKQRATRTGGAAKRQSWHLLFLSTGEVGLSQHMAEAGKKVRAGQEVRLAELQADAEAGHGVFEHLHGHTNGAELSDAIRSLCSKTFGSVGMEFIRLCAQEQEALSEIIKLGVEAFVDDCVKAHGEDGELGGQARRVAERFGLIATAGELATAWSLTGWSEGEAREGVLKMFAEWVENRGTAGNTEPAVFVEILRDYISRHEADGFDQVGARRDDDRTLNRSRLGRAGWVKHYDDGRRDYMFSPEFMSGELFAGHDMKQVCHVLAELGCLEHGEEKGKTRYTLQRSLGDMPRRRVYVINDDIWRDEMFSRPRASKRQDANPF